MSFYKLIVSKVIHLSPVPNPSFCLKAIEVHFCLIIPLIPLKFEIPTKDNVKSFNVVSCQQQQPAVF